MFILDTNVVSELRQPKRSDPNVLNWARSRDDRDSYLSVVTILEIELGTLRISRRDPVQGARLRDWIDNQILPGFSARILPLDTVAIRRCAALHVPDPRPERDAFIAATALVHGMTIVTRNVSDFEPMGVSTLNPWIAAAE